MRWWITLLGLNVLVWGGMSKVGLDLAQGVSEQHVPGAPNAGQIEFYVVFPLMMLSVSLTISHLCANARSRGVGLGLLVATLLVFPVYLFPYGGGV